MLCRASLLRSLWWSRMKMIHAPSGLNNPAGSSMLTKTPRHPETPRALDALGLLVQYFAYGSGDENETPSGACILEGSGLASSQAGSAPLPPPARSAGEQRR